MQLGTDISKQASFYLHSKHLFWEIHIKHYYLYKNGLNFRNAYNPQKAILIDLDEGFFYCIIFFFFSSKKKKSGYKGESGVSCLAQLEISTRGKKKFKMAFAEVPHT